MARILLTLFTLACFTACTTLQPLPDSQPATIQQSIKPGDSVELTRTDGTRLTLKVESVSQDMLVGTSSNRRYEVPLNTISSIGTRTMTTQSKIWTTLGIIAALGAAIAAGGSGGGGGGSGY